MTRKTDGRDDRNFTIKQGLAYTEDNVVVANIVVYKIPPNVVEKNLQQYFTKFGKIEKIKCVNVKKNYRSVPSLRIAFVNFQSSLSAAKVLKSETHKINESQKVKVKACDSWHQPIQKNKKSKSKKSKNKKIIQEVDCKILTLNDDCLSNIFNLLQLKDQINFGFSCRRFREIFNTNMKMKYKTLNIDKLVEQKLTLMEIRNFLNDCGEFVESLIYIKSSIEIPNNVCRIFELIMKHCRKIINVEISGINLGIGLIKKFFKSVRKVKFLSLIDCNLIDITLLNIAKLSNLESLNLSTNSKLVGDHLYKCNRVKNLSLAKCSSITSKNLIKFMESNPNLISLNIQYCTRLDTDAFTVMAEKCSKIETLKFTTTTAHYSCIGQMANLKHLYIDMITSSLQTDLFTVMAQNRPENIETLEINVKNWINTTVSNDIIQFVNLKVLCCKENNLLTDEIMRRFSILKKLISIDISGCTNVTQDCLLNFIKDRPELKFVYIRNCLQIKNDFVMKAIEILKKQKTRKEACTFFVGGTGIPDFTQNISSYTENTSIILLDFKRYVHIIDDEYLDLSEVFSDEIDYDNEFSDDDALDFDDIDEDELDDEMHYFW